MIRLPVEEVRRSDSCVEFYRKDWTGKNIKIGQEHWEHGPAPFGASLWPRYYSEVKRHGTAWFRFLNAADLTFELLLEGTLEYTQDGVAETVRPGEVYIIHENSDCVFTAGTDSYFHRLRVMLQGSMLRDLDREFRLAGRRIVRPNDPERIAGLFRRIGALITEHDPAKAPELSAAAYRLMAEIAREGHSPQGYPEILDTVIREMKSGLGLKRSVREIAGHHGVEVHTLMRLFRKHLETSPQEYLIRLRIEAAKHLLGSTELPMKQIAAQLGYCSPLYFSTAFRRTCRMTPSQYRKLRRRPSVE